MRASAKRNSLAISPVRSRRNPANTKNGIAIRVYLLTKLKKERKIAFVDNIGSYSMNTTVMPTRATPIGAPSVRRASSPVQEIPRLIP